MSVSEATDFSGTDLEKAGPKEAADKGGNDPKLRNFLSSGI